MLAIFNYEPAILALEGVWRKSEERVWSDSEARKLRTEFAGLKCKLDNKRQNARTRIV